MFGATVETRMKQLEERVRKLEDGAHLVVLYGGYSPTGETIRISVKEVVRRLMVRMKLRLDYTPESVLLKEDTDG